jgi:hypothetical protein
MLDEVEGTDGKSGNPWDQHHRTESSCWARPMSRTLRMLTTSRMLRTTRTMDRATTTKNRATTTKNRATTTKNRATTTKNRATTTRDAEWDTPPPSYALLVVPPGISHRDRYSCLIYPTISTFSFLILQALCELTTNKWYEIPRVLITSAICRRHGFVDFTWTRTILYDPLILNIASSRILWVYRMTSSEPL